ncbi:MAG: outer membrane protein assembly factor BamD [Bacteroidales bacterium]|nr:outer membrane protein assembly factor BamD [Bacteroidales bacterium]
MNKTSLFILVLSVLALSVSCKSKYQLLLEGNDVETKYSTAFELFNAGKYEKAAKLFESLAVVTPGTSRDDTVQYYWALSNYRFQDYFTAEANFRSFCEHFPRSPFTSDAQFLRIDCLFRDTNRYELDQTPTYKAVTEISEYMIENPTSTHFSTCEQMLVTLGERLDKKAFEAARLYYNMEDYQAATVAFRNILKDDPENVYREDVLYYTAMSSYKFALLSVAAKQKERYLVFQDDYYNFISEYPDSRYRQTLDPLFNRVKKLENK